MFFLNLNTALVNSEAFYEATLAQRGAWITLMLHSASQENSGKMVAARLWTTRKWRELLRIERSTVIRSTSLWTWEEGDLIVTGYPVADERKAQDRRNNLKDKGLVVTLDASSTARNTAPNAQPLSAESNGAAPERKEGKECKVKERNEMKEREEGGRAPTHNPPSGSVVRDPIPASAEEAVKTAVPLDCPAEFITRTWNKVVGRGGCDDRGVPIQNWRAYLATVWGYEQREAGRKPLPPHTSPLTPENVPLWRQIKATETLLDKVKKEIMAISIPAPSVFPEEHARAVAKCTPLLERKAQLTKQLEELTEQTAGST